MIHKSIVEMIELEKGNEFNIYINNGRCSIGVQGNGIDFSVFCTPEELKKIADKINESLEA